MLEQRWWDFGHGRWWTGNPPSIGGEGGGGTTGVKPGGSAIDDFPGLIVLILGRRVSVVEFGFHRARRRGGRAATGRRRRGAAGARRLAGISRGQRQRQWRCAAAGWRGGGLLGAGGGRRWLVEGVTPRSGRGGDPSCRGTAPHYRAGAHRTGGRGGGNG